jgi:membrane protease subunit HflK
MAWNQPDDDQGGKPPRRPPRARPAGNGGAGGGGWWRRARQRWSSSPQVHGTVYVTAIGVALLLWLATGFYEVGDGERGLVQRFGAYRGLVSSGAGWHLPWPIETVTTVNLGRLQNADVQARMLTRDAMLVNVMATIQYQYTDARAAAFAARDPDALVRELGEAVTREIVGAHDIQELMGSGDRGQLTEAMRAALQRPLDAIGLGARIVAVNLTDVQVPQAVLAAQRELVQAGVDRERVAADAQGYAAEVVPAAQGEAQRQRLEAEAYKLQVIGTAEGDAARFDPIAAAYAKAPEVTRERLYIETMESILAHARKIVIDGKSERHTLVLPLDKLGEAPPATRGAGVVGTVPGSAATAASGTTGAGGGPAAGAPGAGGPAASPPASVNPREDRGRERGERP